ncbi:8490_t:CDS:1 [Cetraspora pellucida]|uniref:8490_t:CDS:1 n=1 Tax=Cetraspora pellucida TaxID=1433469 RepID=A0ACA9JYL8_9GLOM|nr:8490_t:CDS:1 [Cetraspora pellucida]
MDLNDSYCNNSPESQDLLQDTSDSNIASSSTGVTSFSLVTKNRKPSVVTPYFPKKNKTDINSPVICIICKNEFSKKTSTGILRKHLDTQHPGWSMIELFAFTQNNTISVQTLTVDQKARFNILLAE